MREADKAEFAACMVACGEYYRQPEKMSKVILSLWWDALQEYDLDTIKRAMSMHMRDHDRGRFMPLLADLMRWIEGDTTDRARAAWDIAREAVRNVGPYQSVAFDDPMVAEVIEQCGGWNRLCSLEEEEIKWTEKEFVAKYSGALSNGRKSNHRGVLWGIADTANMAQGLTQWVRQPIPVGHDKDAAQQRARQAMMAIAAPSRGPRAADNGESARIGDVLPAIQRKREPGGS
jgi:hypothetical protein